MSATRSADLPEADDRAPDSVDFKDVVGILSRRKGWIFGAAAACCALAAIYVAIAPPAYTATAELYVDPRDRPAPKDESSIQNAVPGDGLLLVESQLKIITSGEVLMRVVDEMNLASDPEFNGQNGLTSTIKSLFGLSQNEPLQLIALRKLRLNTVVKRNDRSFVIDVMVSARTPAQAARLTDAVANAFLEEQAKANTNFNRRISDEITSQLDRMRVAVGQSEQAVATYKAANNLVGAHDRLVTDQELEEVNAQLTSAKTRLNEAFARVKLVESIEAGGAALDALPEAVQSATIVQLRARAADVSREEAQLALTDGASHPALQAARAQRRDIEVAIKNEVKRIAEALRNAAASERTDVQSLQTRFDALKQLSETNERIMVPLRELERKADSDRTIYETFLEKAKTASAEEVVDTTNIRLISHASPPDRKSWPPTGIMMAAALFAGLSLGVVLALARETFGARDRDPPKPGADAAAAPPPPRPQTARSDATSRREQLDRLAAEHLAAPAGHAVLLIHASPATSLELVALELARRIDEAGRSVIVIDTDLARHPVTSRLRLNDHRGVRDVLAGESTISGVAHALGSTNIHIVPIGITKLASPAPDMRDVLASALDEARDFGRAIIDGGKLGGPLSEYGLCSLVDEVIFLASAGSAKIDEFQGLAERLRCRQIKAKTIILAPEPQAAAA
jgi:polysaccharide biosynthesis transport protein